MKITFIILYSFVFTHSHSMSPEFNPTVVINSYKTNLSGKITDKLTGETLPGVSIYIPDLKSGAISDTEGNYKIENLPQSRVLIQVSLIGYKLISVTVDLAMISIKDFTLEESVAELHEIVVTGDAHPSEKNRTPTPITTIPSIKLLQQSSSNIIDAIASQPGVSQITTGSGISKPVIRGLGYNRVVTVHDGIRQEGQQWGDEHGVEIDEFAISKVEILKGPASLTYGSDAMAGVINMLSAPTLPDGKITGNLLVNYQTNNALVGYSGNFAGNHHGFIWDLRYSNKKAHAYQNKYDGYVFNSGYKENTVGGIVGLNKSWGYVHLHFSAYHLTPGIIEGDRDESTGKFLKPFAQNDSTEAAVIASDHDFLSYTPLTPYQIVNHYKAVLNNSFILGNGSLKTTIGFQQNQRQEYADILREYQYGLYFKLNSINYDLRYILPEKNNWYITLGANGMQQSSQNKGTEFLIPEYKLFDVGVFVTVKKSIHKFDISGGIRYDRRSEHGMDLYVNANGEKVENGAPDANQQFNDFHSAFTGASGSIGATYQFSEEFYTKLNISRGFRAPSISELSANGVHEGTVNYIIGVSNLKAENSLQFDLAFGINTHHVTAEINLFNNAINNFIFLRKLVNGAGSDSLRNGLSAFKYTSGQANLSGGEISIDIHPHPLDWLHFENSFSYVRSVQKNQPDSSKYLPFTPPAKFSSELKAVSKKLGKSFLNAYLKLGVDNYFAQNNFYAAYGTETATPGFTLINAGMGADIVAHNKPLCSIYISANNLTDVAYQSHLSRLKYESINPLTGRTGVFNMGRNFSFKLLMPIVFSK
ncbi:MAG: TonB-dependent receptor [Saprospiraceae bacterium]